MSGLNPNAHEGKKRHPKVAATGNKENASSSKKPDAKSGTPRAPNPAKDGARANPNLKKAKPQGRKPQQLSTSTAVGSSSGQAPPTQRPPDSSPKFLKHGPGQIGQDSQTKNEGTRGPPKQKYSFGDFIGDGGFSDVYECTVPLPDQKEHLYAVKTLRPIREDDENWKQMQTREEEILVFLRDHPKRHGSIIEFIESFKHGGQPFKNETKPRICFVFEYILGRSLRTTLFYNVTIKDVGKIKRISVQILGGLQFLHENNIVHCDIQPKNILFKTDDPWDYTIKIIDFGSSQRGPVYSNRFIPGAQRYHPPEVLVFGHERLVSPKMDIWGFGIVLWEMFHGLDKFPIQPMIGSTALQRNNNQLNAARKDAEDYNKKEFEKELEFNTDEWKSNPKAVPLAKGILDKDHSQRLTAKQALKLTWLNE